MAHLKRQGRRAFTIIELLVVILIIGVLVETSLFLMESVSAGGVEAAMNALGAAVSSARTVAATRPATSTAAYKGAALIFMPDSSVVVVQHDPTITDKGDVPLSERSMPLAGYRETTNVRFKAFRNVGFAGFYRSNANTQAPVLVSPPFAVLFDANGQMINRRTASPIGDGYVYYSGRTTDGWVPSGPGWNPPANIGMIDGSVNANSARTTTYNPYGWDPRHYGDPNALAVRASTIDASQYSRYPYRLPFDKIDSVMGVVVYDQRRLESAATATPFLAPQNSRDTVLQSQGSAIRNDGAPATINTPAEWIYANGVLLLFNRYSGRLEREGRS